MCRYLLVLCFIMLAPFIMFGQIKTPASPTFSTFSPVTTMPGSQPGGNRQPANPAVEYTNKMYRKSAEQNEKILKTNPPGSSYEGSVRGAEEVQSQTITAEQQAAEREKLRYEKSLAQFKFVFTELLRMQRGKIPFSLKRAVFLVEGAYTGNAIPYSVFNKKITDKVHLLEEVMKREQVARNSLGKNYAIQKLFAEDLTDEQGRLQRHYTYDFEDPFGENDYSKMFVGRLLHEGTGQCHSMPLLYLILAEELKAKAWLSISPNHSFIVFSDSITGELYNFETTNGNPASKTWAMASGYISTAAIRNKIYLDTLNRSALLAYVMADLVKGYSNKMGDDNFVIAMADSIIKICPNSIDGYIMKANAMTIACTRSARAIGLKSDKQFYLYPELSRQNKQIHEIYDIIDELGYNPMPIDKYRDWLASADGAARKAESLKLKKQISTNAKR
ncbi:MAG: hypothetical protein V4543_14345 [Bacteroidota bacterium]